MPVNVKNHPVQPIVLKELALRCGISQAEIARASGRGYSTISYTMNRGYIPQPEQEFKKTVELLVTQNAKAMAWLQGRDMGLDDIWGPAENGDALYNGQPAGKKHRKEGSPAILPGKPEEITVNWEVEMINSEAMKHFKLFRNPFIDDVQKDADIFMSDEHRYIEAAMLDAARHGGFLAVIGEVGSGKSVMRRKVIEQLKRDGDTLVIFPQMIDKTRLTAGSICDAIIYDISSERPRMKLEAKTRQVQSLLLDRAKSGYRACLVVEEAHDLNVQTLKYLKRFYELEDGYRKLLGIILIGQTELRHMFNESTNVDMREVIRRVQTAEIKGLNGNLENYLALKFKRVGKELGDVFQADAFHALSRRMVSKSRDGRGEVSHAYPLLVNNYTAKAINLAFDMGESRVSAEVIDAI